MNSSIISRLRAIEKSLPRPISILVQDREGNQFECGIAEFEAHGEPYEGIGPNGGKIYGREWDFIKIASGTSDDEVLRVIAANIASVKKARRAGVACTVDEAAGVCRVQI